MVSVLLVDHCRRSIAIAVTAVLIVLVLSAVLLPLYVAVVTLD
jgi:hypothetical protein